MSAAPMASHTIMAPTQPDLSQPPDFEEASSGAGLTNLDHYRPFLRELDLDLLKMFSYDQVLIFLYCCHLQVPVLGKGRR